MGKKEKIQKELDLILEKLRFWRYVVLGILSGSIGLIISFSQNKLTSFIVTVFLILGFFGIVISVKRISILDKEFQELLDELERID